MFEQTGPHRPRMERTNCEQVQRLSWVSVVSRQGALLRPRVVWFHTSPHCPWLHWASQILRILQIEGLRQPRAVRWRLAFLAIKYLLVKVCRLFFRHHVTEPNSGLLAQPAANPCTDPGWGEGKGGVYCKVPSVGLSKDGNSCSKDPNSPMAFGEKFLKAVWGEGRRAWSAPGHSYDWLVVM